MARRAAIGFRAHSGWAAAVAVAGPADGPAVITRRRIELADRGGGLPAQPYHAAVGLEIGEAARVVGDCAARAAEMGTAGLRVIIQDLQAMGHETAGCGLLLASGRKLPGLDAILASHALIHTAEGELFREALRAACAECGLRLVEVKERELFARAAAELGIAVSRVEERVAAMGKAIGPPWRQDEKFSAVAAWMAMAGIFDGE